MNQLILIIAYLIGSIPSALLIGKYFYKGTDVRNVGSGNLGTTNMLRSLGIKAGIATAAFDVAVKGVLVTLIATFLYNHQVITIFPMFIGFMSAFGHAFPIFAKFKGGKCVATTIGILVATNFFVGLFTTIILFSTVIITKKMAIASFLATAFGLCSVIFINNFNLLQILIVMLFYLLIVYLHRENITRLINHEEKELDLIKLVKDKIKK